MTRAYRPVSVERDAALYALGLDPAYVDWHHEPPLELRPFEIVNGRKIYTPGENDPRHLVPMAPDAHEKRTTKGRSGATTLGSDRHAIDKTKRIRDRQAEFRRVILAKAEGEPRSRQQGKRPWPKRSMRRKQEARP